MAEPYVMTATPVAATPNVDPLGAETTSLLVGKWKADLFSCFDSVLPNCLCSCCCPCVTLGQIVARLGLGEFMITAIVSGVLMCTSFGGLLVLLYVFYLRYKFRTMLRIPGSACGDCCASFWCGCCVLAQMATHADAYTPGECTCSAKNTLPGYSSMLSANPAEPTPTAVPVAEPSTKV